MDRSCGNAGEGPNFGREAVHIVKQGEHPRKVIHGIDRVQKEYFDTLISPSRFVIGACTGAMSTKTAKEGTTSPQCYDVVGDQEMVSQQAEKEKREDDPN